MSDSKNVPASSFDIVLLAFKSETFVCSVCGEIVFPKVIESDGNVFIETTRAELRGGIGNRLLRGDVCEKCAESKMWAPCEYTVRRNHRTLSDM